MPALPGEDERDERGKMKYASVCSGVEAASLAWMPLGWEAVWFSEIEPFPCAVLKERFPTVPNLGDMTKIQVEIKKNGDQIFTSGDGASVTVPGGVDLLVGGTPCQGFSVAGKRGGGNDLRSALCFTYIRLLETMRPRWFVWENVPGVFSTNGGKDFREFIRRVDEVGYTVAWRVLDAQYVRVDGYPRAVPQRRRRVFVIGHIGADWQYPASVLFEPDSLFRDTPPRRVKGKGFTGNLENRSGMADRTWDPSGVNPTLNQCNAGSGMIGASNQELFGQNMNGLVMELQYGNIAGTLRAEGENRPSRPSNIICHPVASTLNAHYGSKYGIENQHVNEGCPLYVIHGLQDPICNADHASAVNTITGDHGNRITDYTPVVLQKQNFGLVRRFLPVETERLMGFPDHWTRIPWRGKPAEDCPDGPRYKACGNSMCVNVMRWIGMRIELVERKVR